MKWITFSKFNEDDFGIDAQDLMNALANFFLESGFNNPYMQFSEWNKNNLEDLKRAIQQALENGELFSDDRVEEMLQKLSAMSPEQMDQLLENLVQKLAAEGHISVDRDEPSESGPGGAQGREPQARFEVTDKSLDFLGFKTLKDLLGSLGKSSFGRHDTRDLATGIESSGSSKQYEFGDTLNLDISETLFSAVRREGVHRSGIFGSARPSVRIPELLRHGADARLQPQHDSLRGRSFHPRQARRHGAGPSDQDAISRR
jgi:Ca-activated chloride channel homolog